MSRLLFGNFKILNLIEERRELMRGSLKRESSAHNLSQ